MVRLLVRDSIRDVLSSGWWWETDGTLQGFIEKTISEVKGRGIWRVVHPQVSISGTLLVPLGLNEQGRE